MSEKPAPTGSQTIRQVAAKNLQRLGYRRIVQLLVYLVIIPTVLLLAIGIINMFLEGRINLLFGILTVSFVSVVVTGVVLVLVFVRREANLSELQADFVSKVSHELRTPLTAIRLFAETIERAGDDAATRQKCTSLLVAESERLSLLIERLLDWGRMESGRKIYELKLEHVQDIIDDAVRAYAPRRDLAKDLDFEVEVDRGLPSVIVDRHAIVDAVVNLMSNAQKYGGTPPVVRLRAQATPSGEIGISVSDNGEGIPHPEHRRIFEKFYRIDDRLSRTKEGSGLGLAIVKHVARAHRARVTVESESGKGSIFTIVLPAAPAGAGEETLAREKAFAVDGQAGDGRSEEQERGLGGG
ncbi:MAG: two-component sensor histidine kinase [Labilithrix sp.]|nr:two-component sensor histidine kinase [Labilithrix sp.]